MTFKSLEGKALVFGEGATHRPYKRCLSFQVCFMQPWLGWTLPSHDVV